MKNARLLADIGGTHCRFAWQSSPGAAIGDADTLACAAFATLGDAIDTYLSRHGGNAPRDAAIAVASPLIGDRVQMTNHPWSFSRSELQARFGFERLCVLNDFAALALALPSLTDAQKRQVGGGAAASDSAIALIGPGTGLGVSGLVPDGRGHWAALQSEGGHATLAGRTARERDVLLQIESRHGHASGERVVSGPGLVDLRRALHDIDDRSAPWQDMTAEQISQSAAQHADCREAIDLFCAFLGTAAGNLALTLGARGGVYIGGGIVPHLGAAFDRSPFRERFESKGRYRAYLAAIPAYVIVSDTSPALRGAAAALDAA